MDMNINTTDFLTDDQKKEIGVALTKKILTGIEQIQFSKAKKIDLISFINADVENAFENGDLYEYLDFSEMGKKISKKMMEAI